MATLLTRKSIIPGGVDPVAGYVASSAFGSGGDRVQPDDGLFLAVKNGSGSSITYTVTDATSPTPPGATSWSNNIVVTVPAGATRFIGPIDERFLLADGLGAMGYPSAAASITVQAFQL